MRIFLYVLMLLAGVFALRFALFYPLWRVPYGSYFANYAPFALLVLRGFVWYKRGRISAPESFAGIPYFLASSMALLLLVTIGIYAVLAATGGNSGFSGVPLGLLLAALGGISALLVPIVEVRDWLALRNERRIDLDKSKA